MPAKYHPVSPAVWDRTFRRLSKDAKVIAFYVWTCSTRCSEGLFRVPLAYIVSDTAIPEDKSLAALEELHRASLIDYDEESETVLDRVALKHNPIRNGVDRDTGMVTINKRLPGALKQLESLSDSPLLQSFAVIASRLSPDFGFAIYEKFSYLKPPSDSPASKPLASPLVAPTKGGEEKEKELVRGEVEKSCRLRTQRLQASRLSR